MKTSYDLIDDIIRREGSTFTDDPADRGGATKYGITQRAWDQFLSKHQRTTFAVGVPTHTLYSPSVEHITLENAREFYWTMYVSPLAWIEDDQLRALVIDSSVQHGAERVTKWLQTAAGVKADGVIGPKTRDAVNLHATDNIVVIAAHHTELYRELFITRLKFYAQIATDQMPADPDAKFLRGWINRLAEFTP